MSFEFETDSCAQGVSQELINRELSLEEEMFNRGRDRFFANINRLREQKNEGGTSYGKILLKRGIEPLATRRTSGVATRLGLSWHTTVAVLDS